MERRQFLNAAVLAGLADLGTGASSNLDDTADGDTDRSAPVFEPLLEDIPAHAFVERYDEHGRLRVSSHPDSRELVAAQVVIQGKWGEAGFGLTAPEARAVGRELLAAAAQKEGQQ